VKKQEEVAKLEQAQHAMEAERQEVDGRLTEVQAVLREAKAERSEGTRVRLFNEAVDDMKRLFHVSILILPTQTQCVCVDVAILLCLFVCVVRQGVHGKLIDLCQPRHKRYHIALTVIMGKNLDAIVVDTEAVAIECIKYLREKKAGVGTFIPLDIIRTKPLNERLR
jgi:structural maintenance of chromosome 1